MNKATRIIVKYELYNILKEPLSLLGQIGMGCLGIATRFRNDHDVIYLTILELCFYGGIIGVGCIQAGARGLSEKKFIEMQMERGVCSQVGFVRVCTLALSYLFICTPGIIFSAVSSSMEYIFWVGLWLVIAGTSLGLAALVQTLTIVLVRNDFKGTILASLFLLGTICVVYGIYLFVGISLTMISGTLFFQMPTIVVYSLLFAVGSLRLFFVFSKGMPRQHGLSLLC